ncbi:class I SAM-dependent methyltransferase [Halomonas halocynthiae]|uniref:class I SAM-dependent methyltransferase n=1 Tax=Halomonas halocynthiae TaxID=176290 RepID=UPI0003F847CE|nr:methyltransferase domain-containing protein [Halomonas halocynthiae]
MNDQVGHAHRLNAHYDALAEARGDSLRQRLRDAFQQARCDPDQLTLDDSAGIDQLHLGGRRASRSLARRGAFRAGMRVLDVGCGTGGASRLLADEYGVEVIGVDITAAFIEVANWLSQATGLEHSTRFLCADAAKVPLADGSVETIWCQHALMNMPKVSDVLAEWWRLLAPGGQVLLHEVVSGDNPAPLELPVPWARRADTSHLVSRADLAAMLAEAGFVVEGLEDVTATALDWRRKHGRRELGGDPRAATPAPLASLPGPSIIFGDDFAIMGQNLVANLSDDRVRIIEGVWRKG